MAQSPKGRFLLSIRPAEAIYFFEKPLRQEGTKPINPMLRNKNEDGSRTAVASLTTTDPEVNTPLAFELECLYRPESEVLIA